MNRVDPDEYFREKLNRLSIRNYMDLMRRYVFKAAREDVDMNEFDKEIDKLLEKNKNDN